jgi:hypothetical protein
VAEWAVEWVTWDINLLSGYVMLTKDVKSSVPLPEGKGTFFVAAAGKLLLSFFIYSI